MATCVKHSPPAASAPLFHERKLPISPQCICFPAFASHQANPTTTTGIPEYSSKHVIRSNNNSFKGFLRRHPHIFRRPASCQITNKRIYLVSTLRKLQLMLLIQSSGTKNQAQQARVTQERCGINFTDPSRLAKERQGGRNPLSQKVVGVKNSPPLTPISEIQFWGQVFGSIRQN